MTTRLATTILTFAEYEDLGERAVQQGWYRNDPRMFLPGMGWYNDWYLEVAGPNFLSPHYHRDWAGKRPPIELVCPNGEVWCIDRKSSNGDGWIVTGEWPNISCSPSIAAKGYHGFLGINGAPPGQFTADLEGRGPCGTPRNQLSTLPPARITGA